MKQVWWYVFVSGGGCEVLSVHDEVRPVECATSLRANYMVVLFHVVANHLSVSPAMPVLCRTVLLMWLMCSCVNIVRVHIQFTYNYSAMG